MHDAFTVVPNRELGDKAVPSVAITPGLTLMQNRQPVTRVLEDVCQRRQS
jgi:hypothetical protein